MALTDTHAHLSYVLERQGQLKLDAIIEAYSKQNSPGKDAFILDIGVEYDDFPRRKVSFSKHSFVRLAAGIWPDKDSLSSKENIETRIKVLEKYVADPYCVAVGECGLDYHWMNGTKEAQSELFVAQAELALKYSKALIVHSRNAHPDTFSVVKQYSDKIPVIIHCFSYDEMACKEYLNCGCYISFAGNITYKNTVELRTACSIVPSNRILIETDAPYMCPEPMRGKASSPLDISRTYSLAAELRKEPINILSDAVNANAGVIFN